MYLQLYPNLISMVDLSHEDGKSKTIRGEVTLHTYRFKSRSKSISYIMTVYGSMAQQVLMVEVERMRYEEQEWHHETTVKSKPTVRKRRRND